MWWTLARAHGADCATVDGEQLTVPTPFAFASRSAELVDDAPVEAVACFLEADRMRTVQIEVHSDSQGAGSYNLALTQQRADAIRDALLAGGIAPLRVTAVGYGETMPITDNQTAEGRAANRRIELHLAPPSERPPSPQPPSAAPAVPQPAPAPAPLPPEVLREQAVCGPVRGEPSGYEPKQWAVPGPAADVVAVVVGCLADRWEQDRQETSLYASLPPWQLEVKPQGEEVSLRLWRD